MAVLVARRRIWVWLDRLQYRQYIYQNLYCMNKTIAVAAALNSIDSILQRGADNLYDKYLTRKLPTHTQAQNASMITRNLELHAYQASSSSQRPSLPPQNQHLSIDTLASKRITVRRSNPQHSKLSGKTMHERSTMRGTSSMPSSGYHPPNDSLLHESHRMFSPNSRPATTQVGRTQDNPIGSLPLEQKRAATCHARKRKPVVFQWQRPIKLCEEVTIHLREEMETADRLRRHRRDRAQEQARKQQQKMHEEAALRLKETRAREHYEELKSNLKEKGQATPPVTNVQTDTGEMIVNGSKVMPKAHILQLEFNPEEEVTVSTLQPKVVDVNGVKKNSFLTSKAKKKVKMTDEEFTNGGERQTSSIPFVALSCGVALSEDSIAVTASRRRPSQELTRRQFESEINHRFKSHIPMVNSARLNQHATIDVATHTARSSFVENSSGGLIHDMAGSYGDKMMDSILWRPRTKSQSKKIRVCSREMRLEMLQAKLGGEGESWLAG